jgi:hypothetical protein
VIAIAIAPPLIALQQSDEREGKRKGSGGHLNTKRRRIRRAREAQGS